MINANEYLYYGKECQIDDLQWSLNAGGKLKLLLEHPEDYKPFGSITKRRGKKAGQILKIMMRRDGDENFVQVDAWFAGWSVSHTKGAVIAMTVEDETFDQLRMLEQREQVEIVVYEIEEDGTSHNEQLRSEVEAKLKGGPLSVQAGKACQEISFHRFLELQNGVYAVKDSSDAAIVVRQLCGVSSRAKLDHDPEAKHKWQSLYRGYLSQFV